MLRIRLLAAAVAVSSAIIGIAAAGQPAPASILLDEFLAADDPAAALAVAERILVEGVAFDTAYARLRQGRAYGDEKRGEYALRWRSKSGPFFNNIVDVPRDYDPATAWQLRVQLHGGVGRPSPNPPRPAAPAGAGGPVANPPRPQAASAVNRIAGEKQIYLHPSGWAAAQWWDEEQIDNILRAVDGLKRRYNVDESKIYLTGISDGGTGVYYMALKAPTPWASYLPLNGSIAVLRSPQNGADGEMYGNNLSTAPFYIVNGELDNLYPVHQVEPHIKWFTALGVPFVFRPQAGAGHNTAWWPAERESFEGFVREHRRAAHPSRLSWETERIDKFNRNRWLVIDALRQEPSRDTTLTDMGFFQHTQPSGRVDVTRAANVFDATTRGVAAFSLLLSPDAVDFTKPIVVRVNGAEVFNRIADKDPAALLRWSARDNDRTMLYGAELKVRVP
jgi:predicted esterase